jgi:hypothetical protein
MTNLNVDEDKAKRLSVLANDTEKLQKVIETKEEELKKDKEKLRKYIEVYLPEAMMGIGMQEFTLVDGTQLTKSEKYYANISQINNAEAMSWLEENGFGPLIRESISANFGHTNEDKHFIAAMLNTLKKWKIGFKRGRNIHHSTLRAFVKEQIESGVDLPMQLFGVHISNQVTIKHKIEHDKKQK